MALICYTLPIIAAKMFSKPEDHIVDFTSFKHENSIAAYFNGCVASSSCYTQSRAPGCMTSCAASDGGG